jgi:hypothetical protein
MKRTVVFLMVFFLPFFLTAQEKDAVYRARVGQRIAELELDDALSLWICDADTGSPLVGALVAIENAGSVTTDRDGLAIFPVVEDGDHAFIMKKNGYITVKDSFTVFGGAIFFNKYSIPKIMNAKHIKIVLDWAAEPPDLDIHVVKENQYHLSYRDMVKTADGTAWLDRDDTNGYGPETVTITEVDNRAAYHVYIHNYSNRSQTNNKRLAASYATLRIYSDNRLSARYSITPGNTGTTWYAADIINGNIKGVNRYE